MSRAENKGKGENKAPKASGAVQMRDAKGRLLPGHSMGRPKGSTKLKPAEQLMKHMARIGEELIEAGPASENDMPEMISLDEAIIRKLADLALAGDMQAMSGWMQYRYGKPRQMEEVRGGANPVLEMLAQFAMQAMQEGRISPSDLTGSGWQPGSGAMQAGATGPSGCNGAEASGLVPNGKHPSDGERAGRSGKTG